MLRVGLALLPAAGRGPQRTSQNVCSGAGKLTDFPSLGLFLIRNTMIPSTPPTEGTPIPLPLGILPSATTHTGDQRDDPCHRHVPGAMGIPLSALLTPAHTGV